MKKPFKKAVAVLLAVLMAAFSVPFTALAAPGDYAPDIDIQLGTFHADDATDWCDYNSNASGKTFTLCGLYDVPLEYDAKAGTITLSKAKTDKALETYPDLGFTNLDADYTYGVGDYFTVTCTLDNVPTVTTLQARISYSDNIEPAGYYSYKQGRGTAYALGTVSECEAKSGTMTLGGYNKLTAMSGDTFYGLDMEDAAITDFGGGYVMDESAVTPDGETVDISSLHDDYFCNPETGDLSSGYTYEGRAPLATFVFKIVGEGPIDFYMGDPDNTIGSNGSLNWGYGFYTAVKEDGTNRESTTTYAPMWWNGSSSLSCTSKAWNEDGTVKDGLVECPGSCKMTFFGENEWNQTEPQPTEYTVTFKYADGTVASEATYAEGTAAADVAVPANTAATSDADNHYTYAWPAVADVTADATYEEVKTTTAHAWDEGTVTTPATCGEDGVMTYTCTVGGETRTEAIPATGNHTWDEGVVTKEPTETETGIRTHTCTVCGQTKEETIPVKEHEHAWGEGVVTAPTCTEQGYTTYTCACGETRVDNYTDALGHAEGEAVVTVTKEATCTEAGSKNTTVKCTRCGEVISSVDTEIDPLGHVDGEAVETVTKEATCTEAGSKNTTVRCTRCNEVISSVDTVIDPLGHDWVKGETVAPTIREDGYTVYTCSRCGETEKRDTVAALGIIVKVNSSDLGEIAGLPTDTNNKLAYGTEYTLTATPLDGAKFDGWEINGKIVSTDATYTSAAVNDVTINPLFSEVGQNTITVKFADNYGNVFATFTGTADEVAAKIAANEPVAPVLDGYTFSGWSQDITSFTDSVTVVAQYEAAETGYTVTTSGTLTLPAGVTNGAIPYDTAVTVYAEGATAWAVDGVNVGYGDTYTFFVGSDIAIEPVFDAVSSVPTVNIVSAKQISGSHKVSFLATRNIPSGYTLVNAGFVYGKNLSDADLDLDNVGKNGTAADAGVVKVAYASKTGADQFALNYGITSKTGKATAKAFIVVKKGATTSVIYSDYDNGVFTY